MQRKESGWQRAERHFTVKISLPLLPLLLLRACRRPLWLVILFQDRDVLPLQHAPQLTSEGGTEDGEERPEGDEGPSGLGLVPARCERGLKEV